MKLAYEACAMAAELDAVCDASLSRMASRMAAMPAALTLLSQAITRGTKTAEFEAMPQTTVPAALFTESAKGNAQAQAVATAATMKRHGGRPKAQERCEVTQDEAARRYGVDKRTIQNWDAGKGAPDGYPGRRSKYDLEQHVYNYKGRIKGGEQRARELAASQQHEIQAGQ